MLATHKSMSAPCIGVGGDGDERDAAFASKPKMKRSLPGVPPPQPQPQPQPPTPVPTPTLGGEPGDDTAVDTNANTADTANLADGVAAAGADAGGRGLPRAAASVPPAPSPGDNTNLPDDDAHDSVVLPDIALHVGDGGGGHGGTLAPAPRGRATQERKEVAGTGGTRDAITLPAIDAHGRPHVRLNVRGDKFYVARDALLSVDGSLFQVRKPPNNRRGCGQLFPVVWWAATHVRTPPRAVCAVLACFAVFRGVCASS